jgi:hypothetical protein
VKPNANVNDFYESGSGSGSGGSGVSGNEIGYSGSGNEIGYGGSGIGIGYGGSGSGNVPDNRMFADLLLLPYTLDGACLIK